VLRRRTVTENSGRDDIGWHRLTAVTPKARRQKPDLGGTRADLSIVAQAQGYARDGVFLADYVFGAEKSRSEPHDTLGDQLEKHGPPHEPGPGPF